MSYVGNIPTTAAFPFDQFSGNGSTTAFTLSYAPAGATSIIVSISGVVQNPNTYSVSGTTLTFTPAPPTGTSNIAVLYLGLPVVATLTPGNTAYFSSSVFTATASQTVFTPSGTYQVGFINVIRNGSQLAPADYTATNGTTVTLVNPCTAGDTVVIEVFNLTSLTGALPVTGGTVTGATTFNSTVQINGANVSGFTGFKNRIINPGMVIDQRNAGASVNASSTGNFTYTVDRWAYHVSQASKMTLQQSSVAPAGFKNSLAVTSSATTSLGAVDYYGVIQVIEGNNIADFGWGAAGAATITLSFWVRSSLTGAFGGSLQNSAQSRCYPFSYTINAANTWEQKTVTIAGDTTGTWNTNNAGGINVFFGLGVGSTYGSGTANAWVGAINVVPTGSTSLVGTSGATFYITGVQLERGSNATSFEFRDYGRELIMCQRYYEKSYNTDVAPGTTTNANRISCWAGQSGSGILYSNSFSFKVTKRATPTMSGWTYDGTSGQWHFGVIGVSETKANVTFDSIGMNSAQATCSPGVSGQNAMYGHFAASAEL
jgi:hypothetical protein